VEVIEGDPVCAMQSRIAFLIAARRFDELTSLSSYALRSRIANSLSQAARSPSSDWEESS
jgi:hypothetical protein